MSLEVEYRNRLHEVVREVERRLVRISAALLFLVDVALGGIQLWPVLQIMSNF